MGNEQANGLVCLKGYQEVLSLDARGRFRLPDDLASRLARELGRVGNGSSEDRLALYFVPGTADRIFLYPAPNVHLAVDRFENPPPGMDPALVRRARDYFYARMRFVEGDRQNRFSIPDGLRQHARIDEDVQQVTIIAHNHWLSLSRSDVEEQRIADNREAFEMAAEDLVDPVYPAHPVPGAPSGGAPEGDEET